MEYDILSYSILQSLPHYIDISKYKQIVSSPFFWSTQAHALQHGSMWRGSSVFFFSISVRSKSRAPVKKIADPKKSSKALSWGREQCMYPTIDQRPHIWKIRCAPHYIRSNRCLIVIENSLIRLPTFGKERFSRDGAPTRVARGRARLVPIYFIGTIRAEAGCNIAAGCSRWRLTHAA